MQTYIDQLRQIAQRAETLKDRVDPAYAAILEDEVKTYRELIDIWVNRLRE